jgi:hypothetical protein
MGEGFGIAIFVSALLAFVVAAYVAMTGQVDDVLIWALGAALLNTIVTWLGAIAVLAIVSIACYMSRGHAAAHGHVHHVAQGGDKGRESLMTHEKAHQKVCARVGGGGSTIRVWPENGGWSGVTTFHDPHRVASLSPEKKIAISLAGIIAAPGTTSPTDKPHAKEYSRESDNPGQAMREGRRIARRIV